MQASTPQSIRTMRTTDEDPTLSLTEHVVLALIAEEPSHGFAVARQLSRTTALGEVWAVAHPLVYRAMGRLDEQGMIAGTGLEPGELGPTRMIYEATHRGLEVAARWRAEPVRHLRDVRTAFLAKVMLRMRAGEPLAPLLAEQRAVFGPLFAGLGNRDAIEDEGDRVVAVFRYESSRAVERLLSRLEALDGLQSARPVVTL